VAEGLLGLVRGLRAAAVGFEPEALSGEDCAVATGELSLAQVQEVVKTEIACPGSGAEMLRTARTQSLKTLKEEARNRRVGSIDPEELHSLQHQAKTFRWWKTKLGNIGFTGEIPPEAGVPIVNRLEAETDRLWQEAKRTADSGVEPGSAAERRSALAADAFVRVMATGGRGKARAADLIIVCDLRAYRRGHVEAVFEPNTRQNSPPERDALPDGLTREHDSPPAGIE
jgi:hypothetical protein